MRDEFFNRREFLTRSSWVLAGLGVSVSWPQIAGAAEQARAALETEDVLRVLTAGQAAALGVLADVIYPPTDSPGATDIGAVWFMDRAFDGFMAGAWPMVAAGLDEFERAAADSADVPLSEVPAGQLESLLQDRVQTPFFSVLQLLTLAGVFAMPAHGGNRGHEGWRQIGFDHRHAWTPPFGHYDAEYAEPEQPA